VDLSDPQTFSAAYDRHQRGVYAAAYRICGNQAQSQDVVQDVFLRLWRRPGSFDAARGELGPYLRLMARSRALDLWRESQALGRASDRLKLVVGQSEPRREEQPATQAGDAETRRDALSAVSTLPEPQRDAVVMAYYGGLTADEIARSSGVPLGTAKSRVRLGLAKLRENLEPLGEVA
jgi:RNA polymerase sigma-70 factor (ECF subfamily)